MSERKVPTITVLGEEVEVYLTDFLSFEAKWDGTTIWASTPDELKRQLAKEISTNRVEASIPVVLEVGGRFVRDNLRRRHAGRKAWLFEKSGALDRPNILCLGAQATDDEIASLNVLRQALRKAEKELGEAQRIIEGRCSYDRRNADTLLSEQAEKEAAK